MFTSSRDDGFAWSVESKSEQEDELDGGDETRYKIWYAAAALVAAADAGNGSGSAGHEFKDQPPAGDHRNHNM